MPDIFIATENNSVSPPVPSGGIAYDASLEHHHMLATFCRNPMQISFQTQEHDEKIILFLRRHFITNLPWIVITIILAIIPAIAIILNLQFSILSSFNIPNNFTVILIVFYYLILFSFIFTSFLTWFYNVFIVTKKRVIDIDYSDLVIHNMAVTKLTHVQDVNYTQSGFIRSLFNYGDLFVQTAGNERNFEALKIPNPREAAHIIGNFIGKESHVS